MELSSWENLVSTDLPLLYYRRVPQKFSFEWVEWWKNHRWIWGPIFGAPVVRMFMSDFGHLFEIYQYRGWSGSGLEKVQIFVKLKTRPADWITPWLAGWVCPRQYLMTLPGMVIPQCALVLPLRFHHESLVCYRPCVEGFSHLLLNTLCTYFCSSNSKAYAWNILMPMLVG